MPIVTYRVNRSGACPYCESRDFHNKELVRPDRTTMQCDGCQGFSVRHSNGAQYPLGVRTDRNSDPAIVVHHEEA